MRKIGVGLLLAGFVGSAAAGDYDAADGRYADNNDYSAKVYYRFDFGGNANHAQSVGLRLDNERAAAYGAPAIFQASYAGGMPTMKLQGVELVGPQMSAGLQMGNLTVPQMIGLGFTGLVLATVIFTATDSEGNDNVTGTGT